MPANSSPSYIQYENQMLKCTLFAAIIIIVIVIIYMCTFGNGNRRYSQYPNRRYEYLAENADNNDRTDENKKDKNKEDKNVSDNIRDFIDRSKYEQEKRDHPNVCIEFANNTDSMFDNNKNVCETEQKLFNYYYTDTTGSHHSIDY